MSMEQMTLFDCEIPQPLAAKLRPQKLEEYTGQSHLLGKGKVLRRLIENDQVSSMIFWGPPGVGKTTLARIIANRTKSAFIDFSAVTSGIKEIRTVMEQAENNRHFGERRRRTAASGKRPLSLWMRFIGLIRHSKTHFFHM